MCQNQRPDQQAQRWVCLQESVFLQSSPMRQGSLGLQQGGLPVIQEQKPRATRKRPESCARRLQSCSRSLRRGSWRRGRRLQQEEGLRARRSQSGLQSLLPCRGRPTARQRCRATVQCLGSSKQDLLWPLVLGARLHDLPAKTPQLQRSCLRTRPACLALCQHQLSLLCRNLQFTGNAHRQQ